METSKQNYADYIREAFGNGYRISDANWRKLRNGTFYNPWHHRNEITPSKILMFHAKDDPHVPTSAAADSPTLPESRSNHSAMAGISARITSPGNFGRRSRGSLIPRLTSPEELAWVPQGCGLAEILATSLHGQGACASETTAGARTGSASARCVRRSKRRAGDQAAGLPF
jgi:hypothetical protein